ncbi:MAG: transcription antitermination factor NusB [Moraxella sp.]|nr:transcription antitermination factor NusB [Moraxella sp.]
MTTNTPQNNEFDIKETGYKTSHTAVRKARRFALQGIYEWLLTDHRFENNNQKEYLGNTPANIIIRTRATNAMHTVHLGYYHELMSSVPPRVGELSILIAGELVDRSLSRLDPIEFAALLIGAYELKYSLHIPYKVVIDEAIELNAHFGATDGHKFINAVMDKLAKQLRADEVADHKANKDKEKENLPKLG